VRSVKWLTVSYTAAVLLPVTVRALGTRSSVYCCDKDGVRRYFQSPYTLSWRGAKTEEQHDLLLVQFPKLGLWLRVSSEESEQSNSMPQRIQESWRVPPSLQFRPSWASLPVHFLVSFILVAARLSLNGALV
jgi:hypothetical protein